MIEAEADAEIEAQLDEEGASGDEPKVQPSDAPPIASNVEVDADQLLLTRPIQVASSELTR